MARGLPLTGAQDIEGFAAGSMGVGAQKIHGLVLTPDLLRIERDGSHRILPVINWQD